MIIHNVFDENYNRGFALFHQKPARRMIWWTGRQYFLSFPDIIFRIEYYVRPKMDSEENIYTDLDGTYVWFTDEKLEKFYSPLFYNVASHLHVCMDLTKQTSTLENLVANKVNEFWASDFTVDRDSNIRKYCLKKDIVTWQLFYDWQRKTKENPKFVPSDLLEVNFMEFDRVYDLSNFKTKIFLWQN